MRKYNSILLLEASLSPSPLETLPPEVVEFLRSILKETNGNLAKYVLETSLKESNADLVESIKHYQECYAREIEFRAGRNEPLAVPAPDALIEKNLALDKRINDVITKALEKKTGLIVLLYKDVTPCSFHLLVTIFIFFVCLIFSYFLFLFFSYFLFFFRAHLEKQEQGFSPCTKVKTECLIGQSQ